MELFKVLYFRQTEFFEIELYSYKNGLGLNNLQRLICHIPKQANKQTNSNNSI